MTEEVQNQEDEDFEMILLAVAVIASILLGYKNRTKVKKWFDGIVGKLK